MSDQQTLKKSELLVLGVTSLLLPLLMSCGPPSNDVRSGEKQVASKETGPSRSDRQFRSPLPPVQRFHTLTLEVARSYPTDGTYGYNWPKNEAIHGVTRNLTYKNELLARAGSGSRKKNTYCSGVTFEVFFRAFRHWCREQDRPFSIGGMDAKELKRFRTLWYGSNHDESWAKRKRTVLTAVTEMNMGTAVESLEDAEPGDYIQFWRSTNDGQPSGHTAIFLDWIRGSDGRIRGIKYWSSQSSTSGIGIHREYMDRGEAPIDKEQIYIARIGRTGHSDGSNR